MVGTDGWLLVDLSADWADYRLLFLMAMVRFLSRGGGFMCMGGHHGGESDEAAEPRREVRELRDEIKQLKASR